MTTNPSATESACADGEPRWASETGQTAWLSPPGSGHLGCSGAESTYRDGADHDQNAGGARPTGRYAPPSWVGWLNARPDNPDAVIDVGLVVTAVDDRGRCADRSLLRRLQWNSDYRFGLTLRHDSLLLTVQQSGLRLMTRKGHLRLPAFARRRLALRPGDRILLVANPDSEMLLGLTAHAVATVTSHYWRLDTRAEADDSA